MKRKYIPALLVAIPAAAGAVDYPKPNVLMIMVDDLRPELGSYGIDAIKTPVMDGLAQQSMQFNNAYCNAPVSGASRASMLTGLYPKFPERFTHAFTYAEKDAPNAIPISQWFKNNGYYTLSNGKVFHNVDDHKSSWSEPPWRVNMEGYESHWAVYNKWELWMSDVSARTINKRTMRGPFYESAEVPDSAYQDGKVALKTISDLRRLKDKDQPFFLATGFWRPHLPFNAPKKYWDLYDRDKIPLADNFYRSEGLPNQVRTSTEINSYGGVYENKSDEDFQRLAKHGYYACVSYVDTQIGLLLDELKALELDESTIVVILGDHGWHLGENSFWGKHTLMRRSTHVPLIIHVPGKSSGEANAMVELVDLYPTLCDLAGIPKPSDQLHGSSFAPVFNDKSFAGKEAVFVQWGEGDNAINSRYSYAKWGRNGEVKAEMMFDHAKDINENRNIVNEKRYKPMRDYLSNLIDYLRSKL